MQIDPDTLKHLGAGASGSAIAAAIARATGWALVTMFLGGLAASIFVGPWIAEMFGLVHQLPGVGFVVGFLAIMVLRKLAAVVESIPAEGVGGVLVHWIRRLLGVQDTDGGNK